jgi:hypothetical protein
MSKKIKALRPKTHLSACESSSRVVSPMESILLLRSVMYPLGSIASRVVQNADKVLYLIGQVLGFSGTRSWGPATAGLLWFRPHLESANALSSMVSPLSAAVRLVVMAVRSEIADAAAETALTVVINSATVAELLLVLPGVFPAFLSCIS